MVRDADEWRHDPSVQIMRRVFTRMEAAQGEFLTRSNISPFDVRLRRGRDWARTLFERVWELASARNMAVDEETAAILYVECLRWALSQEGASVPNGSSVRDEDVSQLLREVLT